MLNSWWLSKLRTKILVREKSLMRKCLVSGKDKNKLEGYFIAMLSNDRLIHDRNIDWFKIQC